MFRIKSGWKENARGPGRRSGRFGRNSRARITTAATVRDSSVGMAAPRTSMPKPKIRIAFPPTLMPFMSSDTSRETSERSIVRKIAAPPLYRAMPGMDAMTME